MDNKNRLWPFIQIKSIIYQMRIIMGKKTNVIIIISFFILSETRDFFLWSIGLTSLLIWTKLLMNLKNILLSRNMHATFIFENMLT